MNRVAGSPVAELLPDEASFLTASAALPEWRRRACADFRFQPDRRRSVAAWLLLRRLLAEEGVAAERHPVVFNAFGKPAFADSALPCFNLSHSGDWVMAAVSDRPVGCDVERVGRTRTEVVRSCLAPAERRVIESVPEGPGRDRAFCRIWVRKEAYAKAVGRGLDLDFRSFSVVSEEFPAGWRCRDLAFDGDHLGAVVTAEGRSSQYAAAAGEGR